MTNAKYLFISLSILFCSCSNTSTQTEPQESEHLLAYSDSSSSSSSIRSISLVRKDDSIIYSENGLRLTLPVPREWSAELREKEPMAPFALRYPPYTDSDPYGSPGTIFLRLFVRDTNLTPEQYAESVLNLTEEKIQREFYEGVAGEGQKSVKDFVTHAGEITIAGIPTIVYYQKDPIAYEGLPEVSRHYVMRLNNKIFDFYAFTPVGPFADKILEDVDTQMRALRVEN